MYTVSQAYRYIKIKFILHCYGKSIYKAYRTKTKIQTKKGVHVKGKVKIP